MSVSDWERKRVLDKQLACVPYNIRNQFIERIQKEQDKQDQKNKENGNGKPKKGLPKAFLIKKKDGNGEPATGVSKAAEKMKEATTSAFIMSTPRPMLVTQIPGTEVMPTAASGHMSSTSPDSRDGHTHKAYYDDAGNGYTSEDNGHTHTIRSFMVAPTQDSAGTYYSDHPGTLSKDHILEPTPPYTGEL